MTYFSTDNPTIKLCRNGGQPEWLRSEVIHIEPEDREQARCLSDPIHEESQQWSVYINALAFSTFIRWFDNQQRSIDSSDGSSYSIDIKDCSLFKPSQANVLDAVCNIQINNFKFCLITPENLLDETFTVSDLAMRVPEFAAQFYLLIEVREEQDQVWFYGAASRPQIEAYLTNHTTEPLNDGSVLPLSVVQIDPSAIFSYLGRTEPEAIALPTAQPNESQSLNDVLEQLYEKPQEFALNVRLQQMVTLFSQTAVDVTQWVDNQIDKVAEQLGFWTADMVPASAPFLDSAAAGSVGGLSKRSVQHFENAIAYLKRRGDAISDHIQPRYQDITINNIPLCLCSLVMPNNQRVEGSKTGGELLVLLGTPTMGKIPEGVQLQLSNSLKIIDDKTIDFPQPFLYVKGKIKPGERITPTIILGNSYSIGSSYYFRSNQEE